MEICVEEKCSGCAACQNICSVAAISMMMDEKGFFRPVIDSQKCISCRRCVQICPQNSSIDFGTEKAVFAAVARNDLLRENSSSGGVFSLLAEQILSRGGVVFGAAYDENLNVKHISVTDTHDLAKLRGSKYVQSIIGHTFREAKKYLDSGKAVLFSGTSCQIAGLKAFLGKPYDNLLTIDILCHGVPSPAVYHAYLENLQSQYTEKIVDVNFRSKTPGWKRYTTQVLFENGHQKNLPQDSYIDGFLRNLYLRESCYQCPYASSKRVGDITLGDYWGYQESFPHYLEDDDRGISLVIINTNLGRAAFDRIKKKLATVPRTMEDAKRGNRILSGSFEKPEESEVFWSRCHECNWDQLCAIFQLGNYVIQDAMSPEDRTFFDKPFNERHFWHVMSRYKGAVIRRLKGK